MNFTEKLVLDLIIFQTLSHDVKCYFSRKTYKNHFYIFIYLNFKNFFIFFKNSLNNFFISMIDIIGIDISDLKNYNFFFILPTFTTKKFKFDKLIQYNLYDYKYQFRYLFNFFFENLISINTIVSIFKNTDWLERELIEFFNISFKDKIDTRNLLLDYNLTINPLLKNFPVEGYQELYFNFETYNLDYISTEFVEL